MHYRPTVKSTYTRGIVQRHRRPALSLPCVSLCTHTHTHSEGGQSPRAQNYTARANHTIYIHRYITRLAWHGIGTAARQQHGTVWHDSARHGTARHGPAQQHMARHGTARAGTAARGTARHGTFWHGTWTGTARSGTARHGTFWHGTGVPWHGTCNKSTARSTKGTAWHGTWHP